MDIPTHKRNLVKANRTYIKLNFFNTYKNVDFEELLFIIGLIYDVKKSFTDYELAYIDQKGIKICINDESLMQKALINAYAAIKKQTKSEMRVGWFASPKLKVSSKEICSIRKNFSNKNKNFLCVPYKIEYIFEAVKYLLENRIIENKKEDIIQQYFKAIGAFTYGEKYYNTHILTFNHTDVDITYMNDAAQHCVAEVSASFNGNYSIFNLTQIL